MKKNAPSLQEPILVALRRIIRATDLYSKKLAREHTLTAPQLICLRELQARDGLTLGELAHAVSLSAATVSGILSRLETRKLVERQRGATDRRRVRSYLTREGRKLVASAPRPLQESFSARLDSLSAGERESILRSLETIVEMMGASELDASPVLTSGVDAAAPPPKEPSKDDS